MSSIDRAPRIGRRVRALAITAGAAVTAAVVVASVSSRSSVASETSEAEQVAEATQKPVVEQAWFSLDPPASEHAGGPASGPVAERRVVWRAAQFTGELAPSKIDELIRSGQAWQLESKLTAGEHRDMKTGLRDVERAMQAIGDLYAQEVRRVKAILANDPARHIRIAARPRERDPRWPDVERARKEFAGIGTVYGGIDQVGEIHYLVRWSEWPDLERRVDEQVHLVHERNKQVALWIAARYAVRGSAIFDRKSDQVRKP